MSEELPGKAYADALNNYLDPRNSMEAMATIALAYEQRTANLIAIWQTGDIKSGDVTHGITDDLRASLFNLIAVRSGFAS